MQNSNPRVLSTPRSYLQPGNWILGAALAFFAVLIVFTIVSSAHLVKENAYWLWLFAGFCTLMIAWGLRIASRGRDLGDPGLVIPLLFLVHYGAFGIPYLLEGDQISFISNLVVAEYLPDVLLLAGIALASFMLGYSARFAQKLGQKLPGKGSVVVRSRLWGVIVALSLIGGCSYLYYVFSLGGSAKLIEAMDRRAGLLVEQDKVGLGYLFHASRMLIVVPALVFIYTWKTVKSHKSASILISSVITLALMSMLTIFGGRGAALQPLMYLVLVYHYFVRRLSIRIITGTIALVALYSGIMGEIRGRNVTSMEEVSQLDFNQTGRLVGDLPKVPVAAFVLQEFRDGSEELFYGRTLLANVEPVTSKIDSSLIFPSSGLYLGELLGMGRGIGGPTPTLVGDMYMNFGIPGIIVGGVLCGIIARAMYRWLSENIDNPLIVLCYATFVVQYVHNTIFHGGFSSVPFKGTTITIWAIIPAIYCCRRRNPRAQEALPNPSALHVQPSKSHGLS